VSTYHRVDTPPPSENPGYVQALVRVKVRVIIAREGELSQHRTIAQGIYFSDAKYLCEIQTESTPRIRRVQLGLVG